jgi:addiction module RelE/StbE family toxin
VQLRWTEEAASDLESIQDYLFEHAPSRAPDVVIRVYNAPSGLLSFPHRGRIGKKPGTRELVLAPLPYVLIYRIQGEVIHIVRILHGAQDWPEGRRQSPRAPIQ